MEVMKMQSLSIHVYHCTSCMSQNGMPTCKWVYYMCIPCEQLLMLTLLIKICKHQCFDLVYYKSINFCDVEESPKEMNDYDRNWNEKI